MSSEATRWAIGTTVDAAGVKPTSPATAKSVLLALAWYADPLGRHSHPGASRLATHTGLSVRSVRRALDALEGVGLIRRTGFARKRDTGENSRPIVYALDLEHVTPSPIEHDSVTGSGREHDTPSPIAEHDTPSRSPVEHDTPSPSEPAEHDTPSPKHLQQQTSTDLLSVESTLVDGRGRDVTSQIHEVLESWRQASGGRGLVPRPTDARVITSIVREYSFEETLDAIAAIAADEHPRPMVFWIRDRIQQRRKRESNRKQRGRPTETIETAWSRRSSPDKSSSIADRLKTKGNP